MTPLEFLTDHTFRMVLAGTTVIGLVSGALGCFAYLRKQSLISDVISHSALPGTLLAFLAAVAIGADGRSLPALILGAAILGSLAALSANGIARTSKIRIDTAMAVVLTACFGLGMLLMRVIAGGSFPGKGGIQDYLFGNASVITVADLCASFVVGALVLTMMVLCWKEFALRTFDPDHSTVSGFGARTLDLLMFVTIAVGIVLGVKAVGLVLMVAFVVTPPAAARQWTRTLPGMVALSAAIGAFGSAAGAYLSIAFGPLPTGPVIVLTLFVIFLVSVLVSPRRSLIARALARAGARARLRRELERDSAARAARRAGVR